MKNYTRRIRQMGVAVIWTMAIAHELPAQNSTAEVEAHNAFGSSFGNNGGPGGNPGGNPDPGSGTPSQPARTPETFQAAFEVRTNTWGDPRGKQVKQDCAVCHKLSVLINGREYGDGEAVTLPKGETHTVKVKDTPPGGDSSPPHISNQKFTVWPKAVDGQTITSIAGNGPADSPQVFIAKKEEILQYLLDNSEGLMAQDKAWPEDPADEPMNKTARLGSVKLVSISVTGETKPAEQFLVEGREGLMLNAAAQLRGSFKVPAEFRSRFTGRLVQNIHSTRIMTYTKPPPTAYATRSGGMVFDGVTEEGDVDIAPDGIITVQFDDVPRQWVPTGPVSACEIDDKFTLYIQYRFDDGPWITLGKCNWTFRAASAFDANEGWSGSATASSSMGSTSSDAPKMAPPKFPDDFPWTDE